MKASAKTALLGRPRDGVAQVCYMYLPDDCDRKAVDRIGRMMDRCGYGKRPSYNDEPATEKQLTYLKKLGVVIPPLLKKKAASTLIENAIEANEYEIAPLPAYLPVYEVRRDEFRNVDKPVGKKYEVLKCTKCPKGNGGLLLWTKGRAMVFAQPAKYTRAIGAANRALHIKSRWKITNPILEAKVLKALGVNN